MSGVCGLLVYLKGHRGGLLQYRGGLVQGEELEREGPEPRCHHHGLDGVLGWEGGGGGNVKQEQFEIEALCRPSPTLDALLLVLGQRLLQRRPVNTALSARNSNTANRPKLLEAGFHLLILIHPSLCTTGCFCSRYPPPQYNLLAATLQRSRYIMWQRTFRLFHIPRGGAARS